MALKFGTFFFRPTRYVCETRAKSHAEVNPRSSFTDIRYIHVESVQVIKIRKLTRHKIARNYEQKILRRNLSFCTSWRNRMLAMADREYEGFFFSLEAGIGVVARSTPITMLMMLRCSF